MDPPADYGEKTYKGTGKLTDHVAIVTGADSGIGRAVALSFAREGADVVVAYLDSHEDAKETERVVKASGRKCLLIAGDLTDDAHCQNVIQQTLNQFKKIDILVNNAAFQGKAVQDISQLTRERVEKTFKTNIISMFSLVRYAVPHFSEGGAIINTSSIQAYDPSAPILDYACTKASIVAFTKGLVSMLLPKGIRVNSVAPGPVWTPLVAASFPPEKIKDFGKQSPMDRPAQPAELAPCFVFLASQESRFVNGEILGCTGGAPLA